MTVSEKYFLSAEIANKVRREKRVKSDYAVPGKRNITHRQIDPEEFFGDGQTGTGEIPFWWGAAYPKPFKGKSGGGALRRQTAGWSVK